MLTNTRTLMAEWGDCDPAGIVFFPRYFAWFDACTLALFTAAGLPKPGMLERYGIVGIPLVEVQAQFFAPLKHGDEVTVVSTITEFGRSSFGVHHQLWRGDTLAVESTEKRVWAVNDPDHPDRLKSLPIPAEVIALFDGCGNDNSAE
jgi:4-hydroxybenzoyl-CoA thioesterase